jgi:hypothetical protein
VFGVAAADDEVSGSVVVVGDDGTVGTSVGPEPDRAAPDSNSAGQERWLHVRQILAEGVVVPAGIAISGVGETASVACSSAHESLTVYGVHDVARNLKDMLAEGSYRRGSRAQTADRDHARRFRTVEGACSA